MITKWACCETISDSFHFLSVLGELRCLWWLVWNQKVCFATKCFLASQLSNAHDGVTYGVELSVNVTTPHLQSEHHSPGIDQRSLDISAKNETNNDGPTHGFQETDCGGKQQNRPCLHFGSPSQPSSWSFPRPQFFLCSEQIPQDQNLLLAHHALHKDTKLEQCYLCTRFDHCKEVFLDLL